MKKIFPYCPICLEDLSDNIRNKIQILFETEEMMFISCIFCGEILVIRKLKL